jgi:ankyrin repeat protein
MNPLEKAIRDNNPNQLRLLLDLGFDVHSISVKDLIKQGKIDCLKVILDYGIDVSGVALTRPFLELEEPKEIHVQILQMLIRHGAKVSHSEYDPCRVPPILMLLRDKINDKHIAIIKLLIKAGMSPDETDEEHYPGRTALFEIIIKDQKHLDEYKLKLLNLLMDMGADVKTQDISGTTPLHLAALNNHKEIAEQLIRKGAEIDARNEDGKTPLYYSINHSLEIAELLISHGANVNAEDVYGQTPLFKVHKCNTFMELLVKNGADVNKKDIDGITSLQYAAMYKSYEEIAPLLLSCGADPNVKNAAGETPKERANNPNYEKLHTAIKNKNVNLVKRILRYPIDVNENVGSFFKSYFIDLINAFQPQTFLLLLEYGLDLSMAPKHIRNRLKELSSAFDLEDHRKRLKDGIIREIMGNLIKSKQNKLP